MNYDNILSQLQTQCPFPEVFDDIESSEHKYNETPRTKVGHFRADHDGWRWWYTYWPSHNNLTTAERTHEAAALYNALIAYDALQDLPTLRRFCQAHSEVSVHGAEDECNFYLVGNACYYWLRLITRKGDYNMYLSFYAKEA